MAELRSKLRPTIDHTEQKKVSETFGNGKPGQRKLKQYSVYLAPEYMLWLKRRALEETTEKEPVNVSRLLNRILEDEIRRQERRDARMQSGEEA